MVIFDVGTCPLCNALHAEETLEQANNELDEVSVEERLCCY